tara:strand:- start:879 stop:1139 length:261 start_codon:yes stop_codon:yes gene_type:complete
MNTKSEDIYYEPCTVCERNIAITEKTWFVARGLGNSTLMAPDDPREDGGMHPIGNDCAKKVPKEWLVTRKQHGGFGPLKDRKDWNG